MFNKKILKIALMLLVLIAIFHLLTKKNPSFQRPEHIEEGLKCDRRLPHEREDFWDGNGVRENMWGGKKKENLWGGKKKENMWGGKKKKM